MSVTIVTPPEPRLVPAGRLARPALAKRAVHRVDVEALARALRDAVEGEVRFDASSRALYAQDASNYRRFPFGVVVPRSNDDVVRAVEVCRRFGAPIVSRGGGTALAGQTVNEAVVLDFSKDVNRILWLDPHARRAGIELGVVCDDLVHAAKPHGLTWGPKPSTHNRCCFGGMLANNCGGMQAQMNGIAVNNVEALDVLLYDGTRMHLGWMNEAALGREIREGGRKGEVLSGLRALRDRWAPQIRARYPKLPRRVSGYNLDQLLPGKDGRFNLARVIVGSEGTLATMLEATVELIEDPPVHAVVMLGYRSIYEAADAVPSFLKFRPLAVEGMDHLLYEHLETKQGEHAKHLDLLCDGKAWLFIELGANTEDEARAKCEAVLRHAGGDVVGSKIITDPQEQQYIWDVREGGLGATAFVPGQPDTWSGWEDSAVPVERLGGYLRDLRKLFTSYGYHPSLYGHFGMGLVHCRVGFDMYSQAGVEKYRRFVGDAADLVVSYGGSLSGEHGDGESRAELLVKMFGPELMGAMRELKEIFDPFGKMNPGKVVDPYPIVSEHLRLWPHYEPAHPKTQFRYPADDGSFARATLRCVGVGRCRRKDGAADGEHDVMCPSYMVTREEKHSTRGRAHLLWEMLRGDGSIKDGFRSEGVKEALDLCLSCKGCKSDCPVNVDMATYKAEFLSHYYAGRLRPRHAYAFGYVDRMARLASHVPGLANLVTQLPGTRALAKLAAGVSQEAQIPAFSPETFRQRFAKRVKRAPTGRGVVLWADTFNEHFHPETLMAATEVLEAAGYDVLVPPAGLCCGRPLYDFGMLDAARGYLERVLRTMRPAIEQELPVVVLEPSCASVFKDEMHEMMPDRSEASALRDRTMLLSELLANEAKGFELPKLARRAVVHGHCHHKASFGLDAERHVLTQMGVEAEFLSAGCCGMAGSFGYVAETHDVGKAAGERALLPRVRDAEPAAIVMTDGFSCRSQIDQGSDRRALHLAEVIKLALDHGPAGPPGPVPERAIARRRRAEVRGSMVRAALGLAAVTTIAVLAAVLRARR